jgi:predicted dienelactone hydrolase
MVSSSTLKARKPRVYPAEILLFIVVLVLLTAQTLRRIGRIVALAASAIGFATIVSSSLLGQARWQMAPAYLLLVILSLLLFKRSYSHVALRSIGIAFGALLLGVGVFLSLALPIVTLAAPDGPHVVGSRSFSLIDESRNEAYFGAPDERREIYLQLWYPGTIDRAQPRPAVRTLWQELYRGPRDPVAFLFGYLRGVETHSYQDIPLATADTSYPVIVFSHSMGLNAEQNTPLMEHLASHGYVVIGISHTRMTVRAISSQGHVIYPDPNRLREAFTEGAADAAEEFDIRAARAVSPEERAEIAFELDERATSMNEQVAIRVADARFVLDVIATPAKGPAELARFLERVDSKRIGLLGMSLGGATVVDVCKIDERCRAGVNLDGVRFGRYRRQPLQTPFLSFVSAGNQKFGESLLVNSTSDYYEVLLEGAGHSDFSDMTFLMPFMKWLGANGPIEAARMMNIVNTVSQRFFDAHLRGGPKPRFDIEEFPELRVTMNNRSSN